MSGPGRIRQKWRDVRPFLLASPIYLIAAAIGRTLRTETRGFDKVQAMAGGKVFAVWHGRTFIGASLFRDRGTWTIISHSKDGEMQNSIFRRFGFQTIRGSSKRGGVGAAIESVKVLRAGGEMAFTPDGPRGPSGVVQEGLVLMARKSGAPVFPVAVSARRRWLMKSWDRYMVPKPFSRALVVFGDPMFLPEGATPQEQEAFRVELEAKLHQLEAMAEAEMGHPKPNWHKSPLA